MKPIKLWTTPSYDLLDYATLTTISNGCGGRGFKYTFDKVVGYSVYLACAQHDYDYSKGGSEWRRWVRDFRFVVNLFKCVFYRWRLSHVLRVPILITLYLAVMLFGWYFYNYDKR